MSRLHVYLLRVALLALLPSAQFADGGALDDVAMDAADAPGQHQLEDRLDDVAMDSNEVTGQAKMEDTIHGALMAALKRPDLKQKLGEVLPIIRVMSPPQRLTLAALLTSQVMNHVSPTWEQVSAMFGIDPNAPADVRRKTAAALLLPISYDIAKMFKGDDVPEAQEYRHLRASPQRWNLRRPQPGPNRRNSHVYAEMLPPPPPPAPKQRTQVDSEKSSVPDKQKCQFFSNTLCLEVTDYPKEQIMSSLQRAKSNSLEMALVPEPEGSTDMAQQKLENRRQDVGGGGSPAASMCESTTKLARPKKARTTSGQWKFIVNTGHYTQTLRLEVCSKPQEPCSYISDHFTSVCTQVYNYHRLLTWDDDKGLHMDIFKVPTCCSCQVRGYAIKYPPANDINHQSPYPGSDFAVDDSFGGHNDQTFEVQGSPFQGAFHDLPLDESHLLQQGAIIEQQLANNRHVHRGGGGGGGGDGRPPFLRQDLKKHGSSDTSYVMGLVPPRGPQFDHGFVDNNIRRSRLNHTATADHRLDTETPLQETDSEIIRGVGSSRNPGLRKTPPVERSKPPTTERHGNILHNPNPPYQRLKPTTTERQENILHNRNPPYERLKPTSTESPGGIIFSRNTPQYSSVDNYGRPTISNVQEDEETAVTKPENHKVNYNYHPIIDFFKTRADSGRLASRSGEGWTPIVGASP